MLVNNFLVGLIGFVLVLFGFLVIGLIVDVLIAVMVCGVEIILNVYLILLMSIFIELVKVFFLNNVINYGILIFLGIE